MDDYIIAFSQRALSTLHDSTIFLMIKQQSKYVPAHVDLLCALKPLPESVCIAVMTLSEDLEQLLKFAIQLTLSISESFESCQQPFTSINMAFTTKKRSKSDKSLQSEGTRFR